MAALALAPGTLLNETYRIVRCVGRGGMGEVYEATHARLAGRYAVKLFLGDLAGSSEHYARFRREAEVTSALRHPNIVQVIDFNRTDAGVPYIVMEFLEGTELSREIDRAGAMPVARVAGIVGQAAAALTAAHRRGVIHRDLKPANMFLLRVDGNSRDFLKVLDFGLSKVKQATTKLTGELTVMGTPHYMSPEQALGKMDLVDARTDQFALATIAYEMLTGTEPFRGESTAAIVYQVVHEDPPPLDRVVPGVPPALAAVVRQAMEKRRQDRFPSIATFYRAFVGAAGISAPELPPEALDAGVPEQEPEEEGRATLAIRVPSGGAGAAGEERGARKPTTFGSSAGERQSGRSQALGRRAAAAVVGAAAAVLAGVVVLKSWAGRTGSQTAPPPAASPKAPQAQQAPQAPQAPAPSAANSSTPPSAGTDTTRSSPPTSIPSAGADDTASSNTPPAPPPGAATKPAPKPPTKSARAARSKAAPPPARDAGAPAVRPPRDRLLLDL